MEVLRNDAECLSVKLNPVGLAPKVELQARPVADTILAFDANYNQRGVPLGIVYQRSKSFKTTSTLYDIERPCLCIDQWGTPHIFSGGKALSTSILGDLLVVVQAGPTLIIRGKRTELKAEVEGFKNDVFRRCQHLAVGVTSTNKLIVVYSNRWNLEKVTTYLLSQGAVEGMNMDGGHSAFLYVGLGEHPMWRGNPGKVSSMLSFAELETA